MWTPVCRLAELESERGVAALVNGNAIAIFRMPEDRVYALANQDPFQRGSTLSRGILGVGGEPGDPVPFVASPSHKRAFDLRDGRCLHDDRVQVAAYEVRVIDGVVQVGPRRAPARSRRRRPPRPGR